VCLDVGEERPALPEILPLHLEGERQQQEDDDKQNQLASFHGLFLDSYSIHG